MGIFLSLWPQQNSYRWRATGLGCELGSSKRATCRADRHTPSHFSARSPQRRGMASPLKVAGFLSSHSCSRLPYLLALLDLWGTIFRVIFISQSKTAWQRTSSFSSSILSQYFLTSLGGLALPCYFFQYSEYFRALAFFFCGKFQTCCNSRHLSMAGWRIGLLQWVWMSAIVGTVIGAGGGLSLWERCNKNPFPQLLTPWQPLWGTQGEKGVGMSGNKNESQDLCAQQPWGRVPFSLTVPKLCSLSCTGENQELAMA